MKYSRKTESEIVEMVPKGPEVVQMRVKVAFVQLIKLLGVHTN